MIYVIFHEPDQRGLDSVGMQTMKERKICTGLAQFSLLRSSLKDNDIFLQLGKGQFFCDECALAIINHKFKAQQTEFQVANPVHVVWGRNILKSTYNRHKTDDNVGWIAHKAKFIPEWKNIAHMHTIIPERNRKFVEEYLVCEGEK